MHRSKGTHFIEAIIHAVFWVAVYYALNALTASSFNILVTNNGKVSQGVNGRLLFPFAWLVLLVLMVLFYGYIFWLFKKIIRHKRNAVSIAAIAGWFVLLFTINFFLVRTQIDASGDIEHPGTALHKKNTPKVAFSMDTTGNVSSDSIHNNSSVNPPAMPVPPFKDFSTEDWWGMQLIMAIVFLALLGVAIAYFFIKEWIRNDLVRSQAQAHQYSTEIKFLRSQVNPHFLFNTLNNLFSMAQKKGDDAVADGISKLSGMMRYMLYESNTENVPLQKEIEYLQDCIVLNKLRYADDEVAVNFIYPSLLTAATVQVAPMLFIPFVENAFKHGIAIGQRSNISMAISVNEKKLIFTCENTDYSAGKKMQEDKTGIGLENVKRRLQLVYPGRHVLHTGHEAGTYYVNLEIDIA